MYTNQPTNSQSNNITGYCGYVSGIKSENVFGESYGKTTTAATKGKIVKGYDLDAGEKYKSMQQVAFQNQREVYKNNLKAAEEQVQPDSVSVSLSLSNVLLSKLCVFV